MARNPHAPGASASQSFREDEVEALHQLLAILRRGGDPSAIVRTDAGRRLAAKVQRMRESIARQREGA